MRWITKTKARLSTLTSNRRGNPAFSNSTYTPPRGGGGGSETLIDALPVGLYRTTPKGQILSSNLTLARMLGSPSNEALGSVNVTELYADPGARSELLSRLERDGVVRDFELRARRLDGEVVWLRTTVRLARDAEGRLCYDGVVEDVTDRVRMAEALRSVRAFQFLGASAKALLHAHEERALFQELCSIAVKGGGYRMAWVGLAEQDPEKTVRPVAWAGYEDGYLSAARISWAENELGRGPVGTAIRTGRFCVTRDVLTDPNLAVWRAEAAQRGYASIIALPLIIDDQVLGAMAIYACEPDAFDEEESGLLSQLAGNLAYGVASLRARVERERAMQALHAEHAFRQAIEESMLAGVMAVDLEGSQIYVNQAFCRMVGWSAEELVGRLPPRSYWPPEEHENINAVLQAVLSGDAPHVPVELRFMRRNGERFPVLALLSPIIGRDGQPIGHLVTVYDITERRAAEERLMESQERLQALIDNAPEIIAAVSTDGMITSLNPAFEAISGWSRREWLGRPFAELISPDDVPGVLEAFRLSVLGQIWVHTPRNIRFLTKGGEYAVGEAFGAPIMERGEIVGAFAFIRDVTERVRAEEARRASDELLRTVVGGAPIVLWAVESDGVFTLSEGRGLEALGLKPGEVVGRSVFDVYRDVPQIVAEVRRALAGEKVESTVKIGTLEFETSSHPLLDKDGRPAGVLGVSTDVTERVRAEEALRQAAGGWRTTFDAIDSPILLLDSERKVLRCNKATTTLFGKSFHEIIGQPCWECNHGAEPSTDTCPFPRMLKSRKREPSISDHIHGERVYEAVVDSVIDENGAIVGGVCVHRDVTEHKRMETALQQSIDGLQSALEGTVRAIAMTVEMRDPYTAGHQRRVAELACAIAKEMGLEEQRIKGIRVAGLLHDMGKIAVPAEILSKPGPLSGPETEMTKFHCQIAYDILKQVEFPWPIAEIVRQHHERMDGSGYPAGLSGDQILLEARIMAVADVAEAMASHRPYRPALGSDAAVEEIASHRGILYDNAIVDACLRLFKEGRFALTH